MKLPVKGMGEQEIQGLTTSGIPALRLVQYHSPDLLIGGYRLGDIDLRPSFSEPINIDRAQLAKLGG
jgi:hypothetical protein